MGSIKDEAGLLRVRRCVLLIATLVGLLLVVAAVSTTAVTVKMHKQPQPSTGLNAYFVYTNMKGYFLQDDDKTDASKFDYASTNLGLINRTYPTDMDFDPKSEKTQWQRFEYYVRHLNSTAAKGESYKVLILGRHGEGWHNVEEASVGSRLWDCYWSRLDGNGTISWVNAKLTPLGVQQALKANSFWKGAVTDAKIPPPETYYVSPLQRCLMTSNYTFTGVDLPPDKQFKPIIKERLREALGVHTCDKRDSKSQIQSLWPKYTIEANFTENDMLWDPDFRESGALHVNRMRLFLDDVYANDANVFISCTSHGGSISSLLHAVGHRGFDLNTGGIVPVFLKAQRHDGPRPIGKLDPPTKASICPSPTASSNP